MDSAPTTPPAGPESTVRTGSLEADARLVIPPLDCITKILGFAARTRQVAHTLFEILQITLHYRLQVSVYNQRTGALVFAEFGKNLM